MSEQGARSRRSLLALAMVVAQGGGLACGSSTAGPVREGGTPSQPERVVQRMTPTPDPAASSAPSASASRGDVAASAGAARAPEPITSKHLEAELNRLEAELAN